MLSRHKGAKKLTQVAPSLRGLIEAFGTGTVHCSSHRKPLRLLAPPKTFPPTGQGRLRQRYIARRKSGVLFQGVSRMPFAGMDVHSLRLALLFLSDVLAFITR